MKEIKIVGDEQFVQIKGRGNGIEKIFCALKVLEKHNLIGLEDDSWAITINDKVNIKKIFGHYVPDIDTALGWYQEDSCKFVFPRLYRAMIDCGLEAEKEIKEFAIEKGLKAIDIQGY